MKSNATYIDFLNWAVCTRKAHPSFPSFCSDGIFWQPIEDIHWNSKLFFGNLRDAARERGRKEE